jgi:hypothetical protein
MGKKVKFKDALADFAWDGCPGRFYQFAIFTTNHDFFQIRDIFLLQKFTYEKNPGILGEHTFDNKKYAKTYGVEIILARSNFGHKTECR